MTARGTIRTMTALLSRWLERRAPIAEAIERQLINAQHKEPSRRPGRDDVASRLDACFFEPVRRDAHPHHLDPVELVLRACDHWDRTRWPGRNGRLAFARTVFSAYVL